MATYKYLCLSCERPFEERVRRRFSFLAPRPAASGGHVAGAGCGCGGACACRG